MRKTPPKNLGRLFDWHASNSSATTMALDRPFDIAPDGGLEFGAEALAALVTDASAWLHAAGARRGDCIAVIKENHFDVIVLSAAAARIGVTAATISAANRSQHLYELLTKLQPILTLISAAALDRATSVGVDLTAFGRVIVIGIGETEVVAVNITRLDEFRGAPIPPANIKPDDEMMMITHTSGTTDTPKLVVHSADSNRAGTRLELLPLPFAINGKTDIALSSISFAHSRAYTWTAAQFYWAPKRLVVASSHAVADVERVFERERPTTVEATPNVFQHWLPLVRRRPEIFRQVRYYMNTFDLMHPSIARPFLEASEQPKVLWAHSWGQSETGPIAGSPYTLRKLDKFAGTHQDNMNGMGWAWPGLVRAKVADPNTGRTVKRGEIGVLLVKTKSLCIDYLGESDRHDAKRSGTWWNTGDVGYKDALGRIHFLDRAVDAVPGGSATELESLLLQRIPGAVEVIVLTRGAGRPQPVVGTESGELAESDWASATADLIALESPVVIPWEELPRTSTWKIRRKELREIIFASQHDDTVLEERFT
ncbi:long-chain acyl-CoA synthetase [Rathayibacter rathayi]|uniref:AMP-binding protein n=1 Tax=Rathayibacter rathayi TaxID=33887 RepID=UPI000CE8D1EE|nr:class I adenylate-forming enzyme family protein [Rathayibacter rathayi]PPF22908.1 long-chain acyl-CoA synthetase [Rathayibacter rathayi]PPG70519.1 long-chain acyl-CoA synthetase [Rathayibacter rathayi]PPG76686.1 long-chain acyl-CoA synthetase [Rathayibacter rathayi]PPG93887.1 long-chain acyl-CoA synthetase [Rathayibacter rathayi]PPH25259.1 long-chain acyl-CoA synthetase [Rathayibacter rathayi]